MKREQIIIILGLISIIIIELIIIIYPLFYINFHKSMCKDYCFNEYNNYPSHVELFTGGTVICKCCNGAGATILGINWNAPYIDKYVAVFDGGYSMYSGQNCIKEVGGN